MDVPRDEAFELDDVLTSVDGRDAKGFRSKLSTDDTFLWEISSSGHRSGELGSSSVSSRDSKLFFHPLGLMSFETILARFNVKSSSPSEVSDVSLFSETSIRQNK